jgi:hypothetical protein
VTVVAFEPKCFSSVAKLWLGPDSLLSLSCRSISPLSLGPSALGQDLFVSYAFSNAVGALLHGALCTCAYLRPWPCITQYRRCVPCVAGTDVFSTPGCRALWKWHSDMFMFSFLCACSVPLLVRFGLSHSPQPPAASVGFQERVGTCTQGFLNAVDVSVALIPVADSCGWSLRCGRWRLRVAFTRNEHTVLEPTTRVEAPTTITTHPLLTQAQQ